MRQNKRELGEDTTVWVACPTCGGQAQHGQPCDTCEGQGFVEDSDEEPDWPDDLREFLRAYAMIEKYGLDGWLRLTGGGEPSVDLGDLLLFFGSELDRLDHEHRADEARTRRREAPRG